MPYSIHKVNNGYVVKSPTSAWHHATKAKAESQMRLLNAIEHGYSPEGSNKNFKPGKKK